MSDFIQITWTAASIDDARRLARYFVQERLAATAHILPWIETLTMLNNQLDTVQESQITLIAPSSNLNTIKEIIQKNSKYQIPEIASTPFTPVNQDYSHWLEETTALDIKK